MPIATYALYLHTCCESYDEREKEGEWGGEGERLKQTKTKSIVPLQCFNILANTLRMRWAFVLGILVHFNIICLQQKRGSVLQFGCSQTTTYWD